MSHYSQALLNHDLRRRRDDIAAVLLKADRYLSLEQARENAEKIILREDPLEGPLLEQLIQEVHRTLSAAGIRIVEIEQ